MTTVTSVIKSLHQPRGGYLPLKDFTKTVLTDGVSLHKAESIPPTIIGLSVDYLTRFMLTGNRKEAFSVSLLGGQAQGEWEKAVTLLDGITGIDPVSIVNACKITAYDTFYRTGGRYAMDPQAINPDADTMENIATMVTRGIDFFEDYGPMTRDGFEVRAPDASHILIGDGDFLTEDTLWDFKVLRRDPSKEHTLQLLVYYLMGMRGQDSNDFTGIKNLGIFNPRLNTVYSLPLDLISQEIMDLTTYDIIGYPSEMST